jgi:hypothetical protein
VTEIGAHSGPGRVARWDQSHAEAIDALAAAEGFILLTFDSINGGSQGEIRACSKVGGPEVMALMLGHAHTGSEEMLRDLSDWLAAGGEHEGA